MKTLIKKLLRENLLFEAESFEFSPSPDSNREKIVYYFNVENLAYYVYFLKDDDEPDTYSVGFGITNKMPNVRINKGVSHLNSILTTVDKIVYDAVKSYKIKFLIFVGDNDEGDEDNENETIRTKIYLRYIKNIHPNADITVQNQNHVTVDMTSIYPELFPNKDNKARI